MTFLYKANATRGREWARCFAARAPDLLFRLWPDVGDPAQVRYLTIGRHRRGETLPGCVDRIRGY